MDFIRRNGGKKFDIFIIDPPYKLEMYNPALKALIASNMIKNTSLIVCESGTDEIFNNDIELQQHFDIAKQNKYGNTFITILKLHVED